MSHRIDFRFSAIPVAVAAAPALTAGSTIVRSAALLLLMLPLTGCDFRQPGGERTASTSSSPTPRLRDPVVDDAVKTLRGLGAEVEFFNDEVVSMRVWPERGESITFRNKDLAIATAFPHLERLALGDTQVTDAGLVSLAKLLRLKSLTLVGAPISDAGLAHVATLQDLESLSLAGTNVSDAGLAHLKDMAQLTLLNLSGTYITNEGLHHLKSLTNLEDLYLGHTDITDRGLVHLNSLIRLKNLDLSGIEITDTGVGQLKALPNLRGLSVENSEISDTTLASLSQMKDLEWLSLINSRGISDEELMHLRRALPRTEISYFWAHD